MIDFDAPGVFFPATASGRDAQTMLFATRIKTATKRTAAKSGET
jgi:hypothetical protein